MHKINTNIKTLLIIICLIAVIIASGSLTLYYLNVTADKLEYNVKNASESVKTSQWKIAEDQLGSFEQNWEKTKVGWAVLLDHFEIDNIDNSLSKSQKYIESRDPSLALAELEALRQYILHIPEKEGFSLENIL